MPGFSFCGQGAGSQSVNGLIETRRKHRWQFLVLGGGAFAEESLLILQSAQRPKFKFNTADMHHNQEVVKVAGKQEWEPTALKFYDAENPDVSLEVWKWVTTVVNMPTANVNAPRDYKRPSTLEMVNGQGAATETWHLCNSWPESVNWGELDYGGSEICTIEVSVRYDRAVRDCGPAASSNPFGPAC